MVDPVIPSTQIVQIFVDITFIGIRKFFCKSYCFIVIKPIFQANNKVLQQESTVFSNMLFIITRSYIIIKFCRKLLIYSSYGCPAPPAAP